MLASSQDLQKTLASMKNDIKVLKDNSKGKRLSHFLKTT